MAPAASPATTDWERFDGQFWALLVLAAGFAFMNAWPALERRSLGLYAAHALSLRRALALSVGATLLLMLSLGAIVGSSFNPFIYFRF